MKDLSKIEVIWYEVPGHPDFKYTSSGRIEYKGIKVKGRIYYVDGELMWSDDIKTQFNITYEQLETIIYEELETDHDIHIVTKSVFYLMYGAKHVEQYVDDLVKNSKAVVAFDMKTKETFLFDHVYDGIYEMNQSYNGVMAVLNGEKESNRNIIWLYTNEEDY